MKNINLVLMTMCVILMSVVSCQKEPAPIGVTNVTLNTKSITMSSGDTFTLIATVSPEDAEYSSVIWSSSDESVVSVVNGFITAYAEGKAMITAKEENSGNADYCTVEVLPRYIPIRSLSLSKTSLTVIEGDSEAISVNITPFNATNKNLFWESSNPSVAKVEDGTLTALKKGNTTIRVKAEDGDFTAVCRVTVNDHYNNHDYVDLGLPSGIKWATMNIGATTSTGFGGYYSWGEISVKDDYTWPYYKFCSSGSSYMVTKYCLLEKFGKVDNKKVLDPEDDVAHVEWGGTWHMPDFDNILELIEKCSWKWTSVDGVSGYKVTGPNGNIVFFPASRGKIAYNIFPAPGSYWTRTLSENYNHQALMLSFSEEHVAYYAQDRSDGYTVRAVSE